MIAKAGIRRVQEWMGHADVATTMKYLHYVERPDEARLVAEAFSLELDPSPHPPSFPLRAETEETRRHSLRPVNNTFCTHTGTCNGFTESYQFCCYGMSPISNTVPSLMLYLCVLSHGMNLSSRALVGRRSMKILTKQRRDNKRWLRVPNQTWPLMQMTIDDSQDLNAL